MLLHAANHVRQPTICNLTTIASPESILWPLVQARYTDELPGGCYCTCSSSLHQHHSPTASTLYWITIDTSTTYPTWLSYSLLHWLLTFSDHLLVLFIFTLMHLLSTLSVHSLSLLISSSSVSAITAKSSAYSSSNGRANLNSLRYGFHDNHNDIPQSRGKHLWPHFQILEPPLYLWWNEWS